MSQKSKFFQWIDYRVRITLNDGRMMVGTFLAFDKHLNVIVSETEEFRIRKRGNVEVETKRTIGMVIIRGENILTLSAEAPPHQPGKKNENQSQQAGKAQAIQRSGTAPMNQPPNMGLLQASRGITQTQQNLMLPPGMMAPPIVG